MPDIRSKIYPKGSEWRKWDLHIHTPKSIIQGYGGDKPEVWNQFIETLKNLPPEIKVIAVADYLFVDGYEYLLTRRDEIPNIDLIIPNIEFRLDTFSGTENNHKRHNFHVLFDPSVSVQDIRDQLLNCLSSGYLIKDGREWNATPTPCALEELGREMKKAAPKDNSVQSKSDLRVGLDNITYKREDILKNLGKHCFKGKYITCVGYSEWDQSRWDQSAAEKRTLINEADFSLTSSIDISQISQNVEDLKENNLNSLVLHSSDAHKIEELSNTNLWIKADPTFAGLKQVVNEPEKRAFIGETPPNYKHDHQVIDKITISKSNGWFADNFKLELNSDLVAVIGGRGSGKSALVEMIAYGAGSRDPSPDSFINKALTHENSIEGTEIELTWADRNETKFTINKLIEDAELVRYLPQKAVEQLCSPTHDNELLEQIENVIFQELDDTEKMGSSNFRDLQGRVLRGFQFEKGQIKNELQALNKKIYNYINIVKSIPERNKNLFVKRKELKKLISTLPKLPKEDEKEQEELASLLESKKIFEDRIIELQKEIEKINEIKTKIKLFKLRANEFEKEIIDLVSSLKIEETAIFKVKIDQDNISRVLSEKEGIIFGELTTLKSGKKEDAAVILNVEVKNLVGENLESLSNIIDKKNKETKAYETKKMKYQQQKKKIFDLEKNIDASEEELNKIENEIKLILDELKNDRIDKYCEYFDVLDKEKQETEKLYKPLQDSLLNGSDTDKRLEFEAQFNYQAKEHLTRGLNIIDRTRKSNFREVISLKKALNILWTSFVKDNFDHDAIKESLNSLEAQFLSLPDEEKLEIEEQLKETFTIEDFYNWFFDVDCFEIISSLKFDGTDLYLLSPGQKGIVLLMLYLEIDKLDSRPLIIDQPEDNLDNLSIYNDLINFFRNRKQYRQIIIITHNPNLVVNTDAEQVIVANYEGSRMPRLTYNAGSLEDQAKKIPNVEIDDLEDGIIEQVCNILEGGKIALDSRNKKYRISEKNLINK